MTAHRTILLSILTLICVLNLTAQDTSIEVFVYDDYTENPLDSALVTVLMHGEVVDSSYTDDSGIAYIHLPATSVRELEGLPTTILLSRNYPNPFSDETNVEIGVREAQTIKANVYNILGQRVASEQIPVSAGYYAMKISLGNLPQGVYFLRVTGRESETVKLLKMGSGIHSSHPVFSISSRSTPERTTVDKLTEDELMLKVVKERYKYYETSISISDKIAIPLVLSYVSDIDGNDYEVVKIGDQCWMAENLRVTRYRNGDDIPTGLDNTAWQNTTSSAYAVYPHDDVEGIDSDEEMLEAYGALYNWHAVNDSRGLCPPGWYVPSDAEWSTLEDYLGGSAERGGKLKSTRTEPVPHPRWHSPNTGATNESGWSGLPGGLRGLYGSFDNVGSRGGWWGSIELDLLNGVGRVLSYDGSYVARLLGSKQNGFSVRCLRD